MYSRKVGKFLNFFVNNSVSIVVLVVLTACTNCLKTEALIDVDESADEHE